MMIGNYWEFSSTPFRSPAGDGFYMSSSNDEALARLQFLVENRYRMGILLGEAGSGKSTLLQRFHQESRHSHSLVCRMSLLGVDIEEFLQQVNTTFCLPETDSVATIWQNVNDLIRVNGYQDIPTLFLFDDVHVADAEVKTAIARIAQCTNEPNQRLTIVVAADAAKVDHIGPRLIELSTLRVELWPWSLSETSSFIQDEIARCGRKQAVFDVRALDRIFDMSAGNPRQICLLAELALAAGAGQGLDTIDTETVDSVADELSIRPCVSIA